MKILNRRRTLGTIFTAAILFAAMSCDLGAPIRMSSPTEVEGLTGTLVDPNGAPVAGAWVKVYPASAAVTAKTASWAASGVATGPALDSVQTDASGKFVLSGLASGTYNLAATASRNDTTLALFLRDLIVSGKTRLGIDTLKVSGDIKIQITAQGGILSGSQCVVNASPWAASGDSLGYCVIKGLPPGEFQIIVTYEGALAAVLETILVIAGDTVRDSSEVPLPASSVPVPQSPPENASGITAPTATFSWMGVTAADFYRLQIATDSLFDDKTVDDTIPASFVAGPMSRSAGELAFGTNYFWRVVAVKGIQAAASAWRRFSTIASSDTSGLARAPSVPILQVPAQNATGVEVPVATEWIGAGTINYYIMQVATDSSFLSIVRNDTLNWNMMVSDQGTIGTTLLGLSTNTTYYWRVTSGNEAGAATSPAGRFTTAFPDALPGAPALVSPANNTGLSGIGPVTLLWHKVAGVTGYHVQTSRTADFASPSQTSRSDTSYAFPVVDYGGDYHWRVRAVNAQGEGAWSAARVVHGPTPMDIVITPPLLTFPDRNAVDVPPSPTLTWTSPVSYEPEAYQVQVAPDSLFASPALDSTLSAGTHALTAGLTPGTTYFWRVAWVEASHDTKWFSEIRRFTTSSGSGP